MPVLKSIKVIDIGGEECWVYADPTSHYQVRVNRRDISVGFHRLSGPAFIRKEYCVYMSNNRKHRLDGPAIIYSVGYPPEYWIEDRKYSFEKWFEKLTYEQQIVALYNPENF